MSAQDLQCLTDDESMLSCSFNASTHSERRPIDSEEVLDLKQQIANLQESLTSAHEEIINLHSEISTLKHTIEEKDQKLTLLKRISSSAHSSPSSSKAAKSKKITSICLNTARTPPIHNHNTVCRNMSLMLSPSKTQHNQGQSNNYFEQNSCSSPAHASAEGIKLQSECSLKKPTIYVLGDQQLRNLATEMYSTRINTWNDIYSIQGIIKPNTTCTQTLKDCEYLSKKLNKKDVVILGIGSNEKNPLKLYSELCNTLHVLRNNKVFIVNVFRNPYLNTYMLNNMIELLCNCYKNCTFVSLNRNINYIRALCQKLNAEIDYIHYYNRYIITKSMQLHNYKNKHEEHEVQRQKNSLKNSKISPKNGETRTSDLTQASTSQHLLNKNNKLKINYKKGTIPYYLEAQRQKNNLKNNDTQISPKSTETEKKSNSPQASTSQHLFFQ